MYELQDTEVVNTYYEGYKEEGLAHYLKSGCELVSGYAGLDYLLRGWDYYRLKEVKYWKGLELGLDIKRVDKEVSECENKRSVTKKRRSYRRKRR